MTSFITVVSSVLFGAALAQAGDTRITQEQFSAADTDRDGALTLAETQAGMPTLAAKFSTLDSDGDGKLSADELNAYNKGAGKATEPEKKPTDRY
jgi:Ca2+-binding EF-hand superfamily protein